MNLAPVIKQRFFDANGEPLSGGQLFSYVAGTTTPQATYTDSGGMTANTNPVILDAEGYADVWLDQSLSYKFVLKDADDVLILTVDNVIGALTANSVGTSAIQDGAVTGPKIADGAVGLTKLDPKILGVYSLLNYSVVASVLTNQLTLGLRDSLGAAPDADNPVLIPFRSLTATTGQSLIRQVITSPTAVVSSTSTLGSVDGKPNWIYVYALDNDGDVELAFSASKSWDEGTLQSTVAEGGGAANSKTALYSNIARTNKAIRLLGRVKSTQATAGTWATAPSEISLVPLEERSPRSEVFVYEGNGYGSVTNIRRWANVGKNVGSAITYADDANDGSSFTINEDGIYGMSYSDFLGGSTNWGLTVNEVGTLAVGITAVPAANVLTAFTTNATGDSGCCSCTVALSAGDVIRNHSEGTTQNANVFPQMFRITKVSD